MTPSTSWKYSTAKKKRKKLSWYCFFFSVEDNFTWFVSVFVFQWQTNGSMSMVKSSNIAAVWILKSEGVEPLLGPFGVQAFAIVSHIYREREGGSRKVDAQARAARAGEACICDWSPKAPGILECTADTAAVDMVEEEEAEEEWGIWQPAPKGEMLFLASSCRWIEAFAFAHCAGFSTLCKAVYLLTALNRDLIQPCSYTGLTQGSAFTNQTLFWNINNKLIINTKSTEIISVSERIRFQEVKIRVTRD